jgi:hypothetical protein
MMQDVSGPEICWFLRSRKLIQNPHRLKNLQSLNATWILPVKMEGARNDVHAPVEPTFDTAGMYNVSTSIS